MRALLLFAIFSLGSVVAQQETPKPTSAMLPSGPLIKRAPEVAEWTVTFKASTAGKDDKTQATIPSSADSRDFRSVIQKNNSLYHVETVTGKGAKIEAWCTGGYQVTSMPNAELPILSTSANRGEYYLDFSKGDFAGLDWISPSNFVETKKIAGADCLVFMARIPTDIDGEVDAEAVINVATRLPLSLRVGDGLTTFQFKNASTSNLALPERVTHLIAEWRDRQRRAKLSSPP